jgi:hypothetical protein
MDHQRCVPWGHQHALWDMQMNMLVREAAISTWIFAICSASLCGVASPTDREVNNKGMKRMVLLISTNYNY